MTTSGNRQLTLQLEAPSYHQYTIPQDGKLPTDRAAHALFHYYVTARLAYERMSETIRTTKAGAFGHSVGEETQHNFHQLFRGVATLYNVEPERMTKFWEYVDAQAKELQLPLLPEHEWLRFNTVLEIGESNGEDKDNATNDV